ncbi:MAG: hypothetical protein L6Q92_08935 [Phycisphaerae bacterium]|nr:hypothetical protein [Phycisphaerae bacterium]
MNEDMANRDDPPVVRPPGGNLRRDARELQEPFADDLDVFARLQTEMAGLSESPQPFSIV